MHRWRNVTGEEAIRTTPNATSTNWPRRRDRLMEERLRPISVSWRIATTPC
jgi:hypothetical protein